MKPKIITGDLLEQKVEVIVNAWNRNFIPWWLLLPHGVSGAIKKRGGLEPFKELRKHGVLSLGGAVMTGAGRLKYKGIIHVAGLGHNWRPNERSIRLSVSNALGLAKQQQITSIAFPLIGAGMGGMPEDQVIEWMTQEAERSDYNGKTIFVKYAVRGKP